MNDGYEKLSAAVEKDCKEGGGTFNPGGCIQCGSRCFHKYCDKFKWIIDRAKAYGEATGLDWQAILEYVTSAELWRLWIACRGALYPHRREHGSLWQRRGISGQWKISMLRIIEVMI